MLISLLDLLQEEKDLIREVKRANENYEDFAIKSVSECCDESVGRFYRELAAEEQKRLKRAKRQLILIRKEIKEYFEDDDLNLSFRRECEDEGNE